MVSAVGGRRTVSAGRRHSLELAAVAEAVGAGLTLDRLASVDADTHTARTGRGATIHYDALVIACGTLPRCALEGTLMFRGPADRDAFGALLSELERGVVRSAAFVVSGNAGWPLPLYELALLTATHVKQGAVDAELVLVTPESAPLAVFGAAASEAVSAVLADLGITLHTGCYASRYDGDRLELIPGSTLHTERVVALPQLEGSQILGIPQDADGFIATDSSGRVHDLSQVYAAGDITQFPINRVESARSRPTPW